MFAYPTRIKPVAFHCYTSRTLQIIFNCAYTNETAHYERGLHHLFNEAGVKSVIDNKIVFECMAENGTTVCYGFYDNVFSIGLGYYNENEK